MRLQHQTSRCSPLSPRRGRMPRPGSTSCPPLSTRG